MPLDNSNLILSNCLIEAIRMKIQHPEGRIGWDNSSPSGRISFYFDLGDSRWRFRRKLRRYSNKSRVLFWGYKKEYKNLSN